MIPDVIIANTTVKFRIRPIGYPTGDFTFTFHLGGAVGRTAEGVVDGDYVDFELTPENTEGLTAGLYSFQVFATKPSARYLIQRGNLTVDSYVSGDVAFDGRSVYQRIIDAIDATIAGRATLDQQSYAISSGNTTRQLSRIPVTELMQIRNLYQKLENQDARRRSGQSVFKTHKARFE